jgi:hypothetical protein
VHCGLKPINENCASFFGPSIDSRRYAVVCCLLILENTSRGDWVRVIFLKFNGSTNLDVVCVMDGCCAPKAIPHLCHTPYSSQQYLYVLFKAFLYKNVHADVGLF